MIKWAEWCLPCDSQPLVKRHLRHTGSGSIIRTTTSALAMYFRDTRSQSALLQMHCCRLLMVRGTALTRQLTPQYALWLSHPLRQPGCACWSAGVGRLGALKSLVFRNCSWLGDIGPNRPAWCPALTGLTSLTELVFDHCPMLNTLPDAVCPSLPVLRSMIAVALMYAAKLNPSLGQYWCQKSHDGALHLIQDSQKGVCGFLSLHCLRSSAQPLKSKKLCKRGRLDVSVANQTLSWMHVFDDRSMDCADD